MAIRFFVGELICGSQCKEPEPELVGCLEFVGDFLSRGMGEFWFCYPVLSNLI